MRPDSYRTRVVDSWDPYAEEGAAQAISKVQITDKALSIVAVVLAAAAVGAMFLVPLYLDARIHSAEDIAQKAERETKLAREDIRVMQIALASKGINTDEHATEKGK